MIPLIRWVGRLIFGPRPDAPLFATPVTVDCKSAGQSLYRVYAVQVVDLPDLEPDEFAGSMLIGSFVRESFAKVCCEARAKCGPPPEFDGATHTVVFSPKHDVILKQAIHKAQVAAA